MSSLIPTPHSKIDSEVAEIVGAISEAGRSNQAATTKRGWAKDAKHFLGWLNKEGPCSSEDLIETTNEGSSQHVLPASLYLLYMVDQVQKGRTKSTLNNKATNVLNGLAARGWNVDRARGLHKAGTIRNLIGNYLKSLESTDKRLTQVQARPIGTADLIPIFASIDEEVDNFAGLTTELWVAQTKARLLLSFAAALRVHETFEMRWEWITIKNTSSGRELHVEIPHSKYQPDPRIVRVFEATKTDLCPIRYFEEWKSVAAQHSVPVGPTARVFVELRRFSYEHEIPASPTTPGISSPGLDVYVDHSVLWERRSELGLPERFFKIGAKGRRLDWDLMSISHTSMLELQCRLCRGWFRSTTSQASQQWRRTGWPSCTTCYPRRMSVLSELSHRKHLEGKLWEDQIQRLFDDPSWKTRVAEPDERWVEARKTAMQTWDRTLRSVFKAANFEPRTQNETVSSHGPRRGKSTEAHNNGATIFEIQQFLRHGTASSTSKYISDLDVKAENLFDVLFPSN